MLEPSQPVSSDTAALGELDKKLPVKLSMPARLVMVRHGESEANLVQRALKRGVISEYPQGFDKIPDREFRLSALGREQAKATGPWLKAHYSEGFDVIYVSDHTRAKETAALVCEAAGWQGVEIRIDPLLGERNWGRFASQDPKRQGEIMSNRKRDPLHNPMPDGETMLNTRLRSRDLLDRCAREFSGQRVLVFSHGEYIEALWAEIAHMNTERQLQFFHSPEGDIKNCQVVEFASVDPMSQEQSSGLRWFRSSCPQADIYGHWQGIPRPTFKPSELLAQVERYPNLDFPQG